MDVSRLRPIGHAFQKVARGSQLLLVSVSVVVFAALLRHSLSKQAEALLLEQAHVCAAALIPGKDGDLSDAVAMLQGRSDRLLAVGTLDSYGEVLGVYPDRPAHRAAIHAGIRDPHQPLTITPLGTDDRISATAVVVPLNGSPSALATQAVLMFRTPRDGVEWLPVTSVFAAVMCGVSFLNVRSLLRWFEGRVAKPLRSMADSLPNGEGQAGPVVVRAGAWHETAQIAARFDELLASLAETNARTRRLEREAQRQILQQERGFDRELRRAKDRAITDPLTGLKNRTFLEEQLEPLFERQAEQGTELSAVMIDLDHFKVYNDSRGHQVGDALLRFVGALLRGAIRPTDHAVRYGGDEFLLLLPETGAQQAAAVAERVVKLFRQYASRVDRGDDRLSMSAGLATAREHGCRTGHELISLADHNLYTAKRTGKNRVAGPELAAASPQPPAAA